MPAQIDDMNPDPAPTGSPDPGAEIRSFATNTEAPDDQTVFGSEFQMRRQQAQQRVPEGLDGR
jgi:hypothetical protein